MNVFIKVDPGDLEKGKVEKHVLVNFDPGNGQYCRKVCFCTI